MSSQDFSWFETFMASVYGRAARALLGVALIVAGLAFIGGTAGWIVAALGLIPITAAVLHLCPIAPLWGGHFLGSKYCNPRR